MYNLYKKILTTNIITVVSIFSFTLDITANEQIPIEKLVCYGKGTNQALSPSGDYYAAMVPVDKNICDIKDESDQEAMSTKRVLVVTDLATMTPKVISGTTAGSAVSDFAWINDETLLVSRDGRASLDSASIYTVKRDGTDTKLLIAAKQFKNKPGLEIPFVYSIFPKFPNKIEIVIIENIGIYIG